SSETCPGYRKNTGGRSFPLGRSADLADQNASQNPYGLFEIQHGAHGFHRWKRSHPLLKFLPPGRSLLLRPENPHPPSDASEQKDNTRQKRHLSKHSKKFHSPSSDNSGNRGMYSSEYSGKNIDSLLFEFLPLIWNPKAAFHNSKKPESPPSVPCSPETPPSSLFLLPEKREC